MATVTSSFFFSDFLEVLWKFSMGAYRARCLLCLL